MFQTIIHNFLASKKDQVSLDPANYCIYCGTCSADELTREHIIPDGLGGNLILPASSCPSCQSHIGPFETLFMKHFINDLRGALGVRSRKGRKRKKAPTKQRLFRDDGRVLDVEYGPNSPHHVAFWVTGQRPGLLMGLPRYHAIQHYTQFITKNDPKLPPEEQERINALAKKDKLSFVEVELTTQTQFNTNVWAVVLAKIAHSFACAYLPKGTFEPYLPAIILERDMEAAPYLIGSFGLRNSHPEKVLASDVRHQIILERIGSQMPLSADFNQYYVAKVRLFANIGMPTYEVVVGKHILQEPP